MSSAIRSETALVRPFTQIDAADTPLDEVRLVVGGEGHEAGAVVLPDDVLRTARLQLRLPAPLDLRAAVAQTVVPEQDAALAVIGVAKTNRVSKVFLLEYLKPDAWPAELDLDRSTADLVLNDRQGFTLTVAVVLRHNLNPEPLRPSIAGTWLARREFSVGPERQDTSFSPEELTEDVRKQFGLREGVQRFVFVDTWQGVENLSDAVRVYLDPDTLHLLLANLSDPGSIQLQADLAVYATETVASSIARDLMTGDDVAAPSALDAYPAAKRFFENLSRRLGVDLADVIQIATNDPALLRAHLEAAMDLKTVTTNALKEK